MTPSPQAAPNSSLTRFGYAQELFRSMGGFSNFAFSFSAISILTGAATLYGYGLEMGGPLMMTLGWPVATLFTLAVAASMSELCSAYPTAGAMYHWAADLGGPAWGWFVACFNIIGIIAAIAGIDYSCAQFIMPVLGLSSSHGNLLVMLAFILLTQAALNHLGVRLVAILNDLSVSVHIAGVLLIVAALWWFAPRQPAAFLLDAVNSNGRAPYWWAFLLGLLQAQWTYTGFDGSAHLAEETEDPQRRAAWGIFLAVLLSGIVGYVLVLAVTLAIPSLGAVIGVKDAAGAEQPAFITILQLAFGPRFGNVISGLVSMAMWFCGLASLAGASRTVFSLARDHGTPFSSWVRRVSPVHGTPAVSIWLVTGVSLAAMLWSGTVPVVTSISTVAYYIAFLVPIALALRARRTRPEWPRLAVWSLGRFGPAVNAAAVSYSLLICVLLVLPPNELAGKTLAVLTAILTVLYSAIARRRYRGPDWSASSRH